MASLRIAAVHLSRSSTLLSSRSFANASHLLTRSQLPGLQSSHRVAPISARWHSTPSRSSRPYEFDEVKSIVESSPSDKVIIDVREPSEYAEGYIPGAINIPVKSQPDAIFLPEEEFEDRFGFSKPSQEQEVIFYCKSGVRSSAAAQLAQQQGYSNISEYRGSWLDWEKQGGKVEKP